MEEGGRIGGLEEGEGGVLTFGERVDEVLGHGPRDAVEGHPQAVLLDERLELPPPLVLRPRPRHHDVGRAEPPEQRRLLLAPHHVDEGEPAPRRAVLDEHLAELRRRPRVHEAGRPEALDRVDDPVRRERVDEERARVLDGERRGNGEH